MNRASYLTILTFGLCVFMTRANADPVTSDPPANPLDTDGDGIPLTVLHPQSAKLSPEQIEDARKAQEKEEQDKNWLIRGYEQQLKARAANDPSQDESSNLYYQLSQNKDLAKLAGITPMDESDATTSPEHLGDQPATKPDQSSAQSETHTKSLTPLSSPFATAFGIKPFITPLSAPDAAGIHNFYSTLPVAGENPSAPSARSGQSEDSTDMETPGMTAAKEDPMSNLDSPDLTLDVLPGETIEQAKANRASNNNLELPQPMNLDQLHKELPTPASLQTLPGLPGPSAQRTTSLPPVVNPVPLDENAPTPVSAQPIIMPVHPPIANPYDILNR